MKKIKLAARFLGGLLGIVVLAQSSSWAFSGSTHKYVTKMGISSLTHLDPKFLKFYGEHLEEFEVASIMPDEDETGIAGAYAPHFFNPQTGKNFADQDDSAMKRFEERYNEAIRAYKGEYTEHNWVDRLGRALHFLEDMCTPVHTNYTKITDAATKLSLHVKFEEICVEIQNKCKANIYQENFDYYINNPIYNIAMTQAKLSADGYNAMRENVLSKKEVAKNTVLNAHKAVAGMLYKFYCEVTANDA